MTVGWNHFHVTARAWLPCLASTFVCAVGHGAIPDDVALLQVSAGLESYSPAITAANSSEAARRRYITYISRGVGFGNRLQAFQIALLLAVKTNRTLIAQPFSDTHFDFGGDLTYMDLLRPITGWPVILSSDIKARGLVHESLDVSPFSCGRSLSQAVEQYASSTADVLVYTYAWGFWEAMFRGDDLPDIFDTLQQHIRFQGGIEAAGNLLAAQLRHPFGGVHFRLGDREGLALLNCSEAGLSWREDSYGCENGTIERAVASLPFDTLAHVYIATNLPDSDRVRAAREDIKRKGLHVWQWEDFPVSLTDRAVALARGTAGDISLMDASGWTASKTRELDLLREERDGTLISCIEQQIVIRSHSYVPSFPSTWDSYVIDSRLASDHEDVAKQFALMISEVERVHCNGPHPSSAWVKSFDLLNVAMAGEH